MPRCDVCGQDHVDRRLGAGRRNRAPDLRWRTVIRARQTSPPRGESEEQRQYEHIKESAQREGRYGERAAEVAARTVMKQHARKGHRKGQ
jgi:hypothetical protein